MAYDEDARGGYRDRDNYDWRSERGRADRDDRSRGGRGFFERAGDEVASWFGDEDAERRRQMDDRSGGRDDGRMDRGDDRGWFGGQRDRDDYRSRDDRDRNRGMFGMRDRDDQRGQDRSGWMGGAASGGSDRDRDRDRYGSNQNYGSHQSYGRDDFDRSRERDEYRPYAGDYGRAGSNDRGNGPRAGDERNRGVGAGAAMASTAGGHFGDPHYHEWRQRQIDELDRDYDDYRREHQSKFANDFTGWRTQRQSKRQLLGQIREHMDVVGSDQQTVGQVDKVQGDKIILTKNSEGANGVHRSLTCGMIDRVEDDKVILGQPADEARRSLQEERGFVERNADDGRGAGQSQRSPQSDNGPHALERSFSGTYR